MVLELIENIFWIFVFAGAVLSGIAHLGFDRVEDILYIFIRARTFGTHEICDSIDQRDDLLQ